MMDKQVQFLIYGLCDPRTEELRYIGRSSTGLRRAKFHSFPSTLVRDGNPHKVNWIRLLQSQGLQPKIVFLEKCASAIELPEAERRLIALHKVSGRLLNATDGGEGAEGHKQSPETIAKRVAKTRGQRRSEETKRRMSDAAKVREWCIKDPLYSSKRSIALSWKKKPFIEVESGRRFESISEASRAFGLNRGNVHTALRLGRSIQGHRFQYEAVCG